MYLLETTWLCCQHDLAQALILVCAAGLDFSLSWIDGVVQARLLDWNYRPALQGWITMTMLRQVYQLILQSTSKLHESINVNMSAIQDMRLETLINANATMPSDASSSTYYCPHRLQGSEILPVRP